MALRSQKKQQGNVSLYENIGRDKDGNDMMLIDMLSVDEETVYGQIESEMLRAGLLKIIGKYLNEREQIIVKYRFGIEDGKPLTQQEISDKLGISRSYVSRIEKATLKKLKDAIFKENLQV
jgi:RNA polymerase sigma factor, sigma-70 family